MPASMADLTIRGAEQELAKPKIMSQFDSYRTVCAALQQVHDFQLYKPRHKRSPKNRKRETVLDENPDYATFNKWLASEPWPLTEGMSPETAKGLIDKADWVNSATCRVSWRALSTFSHFRRRRPI